VSRSTSAEEAAMKLTDYATLRSGLQANVEPAGCTAVAAVADELRSALTEAGRFHTVEVDCTEDDDRLIIAMVGFEPGGDSEAVSVLLERVWSDRIGREAWCAHGALVERDHVEIQAATMRTASEGYVTVHLVAQASEAPVRVSVLVEPPAAELPTQPARARRTWGRALVRPALQVA
jgi:hypothetical protein